MPSKKLLRPKRKRKPRALGVRFSISLKFFKIGLHIGPAGSNPFHFDRKLRPLGRGDEIEFLEVAGPVLANSRARNLTLNGEASRCEHSESRLVEDILAKSLVHLVGSEIANAIGQSALDPLQDIDHGAIGHRIKVQPGRRTYSVLSQKAGGKQVVEPG